MPDLQIRKPAATEFAPYYSRYIDLVSDGDVVGTLAGQIHGTVAALRTVTDADSLKRYADGKWSIREVVGHMADTERIFAYRALRFARNDHTALPGFEQDDYIAPARFDSRPWPGIITEFESLKNTDIANTPDYWEWLAKLYARAHRSADSEAAYKKADTLKQAHK